MSQAEAQENSKRIELINSRRRLKNAFTTHRLEIQQQAQQAEGVLQPLIKRLDKPKFERPNNEEIRHFLSQHGVTFDFLSPKSELTFVKDDNNAINVYLGKNPSTWKQVFFDGDKIKVEGKEKSFDKQNNITLKLLEGKDVNNLGLSKSQIKKWTKDYIEMNEDRSTVITNVKNIMNSYSHGSHAPAGTSTVAKSPTSTVIAEDDDSTFQDDDTTKDPNILLGATKTPPLHTKEEMDLTAQQFHDEEIERARSTPAFGQVTLAENDVSFTFANLQKIPLPHGNSTYTKQFKKLHPSYTFNDIENFLKHFRHQMSPVGFNHDANVKAIEDYRDKKLVEENATVAFVCNHMNDDFHRITGGVHPKDRELNLNNETISRIYSVIKTDDKLGKLLKRGSGMTAGGTGKGLSSKKLISKTKEVVIIPDNKGDLLERLRVLVAAKHAGHSNVDDERRAILQRLLEKQWITSNDYRKFSSIKLAFGKS